MTLDQLPTNGKTIQVVIFSRQGCHLCDDVESLIRSIGGIKLSLDVVDIDADAELQGKYWMRIPVVEVDGREIFEVKMMDPAGGWEDRLSSLLSST